MIANYDLDLMLSRLAAAKLAVEKGRTVGLIVVVLSKEGAFETSEGSGFTWRAGAQWSLLGLLKIVGTMFLARILEKPDAAVEGGDFDMKGSN